MQGGKDMHALELQAEVTKGREIRLKLPRNIQYGTVRVIILYEQTKQHDPRLTMRQFGQFKGRIDIREDFDDAFILS